MDVKNCIHCGKEIPALRIKALPSTKSCIQCSTICKVAGFNIISGKTTYSELQIISQEKASALFQLQERKGSIAEGVKFKSLPPPKSSNFE